MLNKIIAKAHIFPMNSLEALQANFKMYLGQLRCCYCHCTACSGCDGCVASTSETSEAPKATPLLESRRNRIARFGSSTFPKADCSKSRRLSRQQQQRLLLSAHAATLAEFAVSLHHEALIDRTVDAPVLLVKNWVGVQLDRF